MYTTLKRLTRSQKLAYLKINSGANIFLTGVAGTGKTFLLNTLEKITDKDVYLTASTGAASLHLNDGRTVSSFLGLGRYDQKTATFKCGYWDGDGDWVKIWLDNSIVVIDEISMIGKSQWNYILKSIKVNSKDFRTVQIVIAGDPMQMPPIYWDDPLDEEVRDFITIELTEIVRQEDAEFISRLMDIRFNGISKHLSWLQKHSGNHERRGITLVSTRGIMDRMNAGIEKGSIERVYDFTDVSDEDKPYEKIELWVGMKVLITANNFRRGYVNGDTGVITGFHEEDVIVELDRNSQRVRVCTVQKEYTTAEYCWDDVDQEEFLVTETHQYYPMPLLPAYYLSVRRAQGCTLTCGCIDSSVITADISTGYTAISRFTSIGNVFIGNDLPVRLSA